MVAYTNTNTITYRGFLLNRIILNKIFGIVHYSQSSKNKIGASILNFFFFEIVVAKWY